MPKQLFVRMISAASVVAVALLLVGLDPFLSAGADGSATSPVSVNRNLKGDRLPFSNPTIFDVPDWRNGSAAPPSSPAHVVRSPFACDASFSSIGLSVAMNVYGRCIA